MFTNLQRRAGTSVHANNGKGEPLCPRARGKAEGNPMNVVNLPVDCGSCIYESERMYEHAAIIEADARAHAEKVLTDVAGTLKGMADDVIAERSSTYEVTVGIGSQGFTVSTEASDYLTAVENIKKQITVTVKEVTTTTRVVEL